MKKTLIFGVALAVGLSACEPMNVVEDWAYIQAKAADGTPLCVPQSIGGHCSGLTLEDAYLVVYGDLTGAVELKQPGDKATVKIESTIAAWTLEELDHKKGVLGATDFADYVSAGLIHAGTAEGDQTEWDGYLKISYKRTWDVVANLNNLNQPAVVFKPFSYNITVERVDNGEADVNYAREYIIFVCADDGRVTNFGPKYTGFKVQFSDATPPPAPIG